MSELQRLGELRESGLLSEDEFEAQKALLLPSGSGTETQSEPVRADEDEAFVEPIRLIDGSLEVPDGVDKLEVALRLITGDFLNERSLPSQLGFPGSWAPYGGAADQICRSALADPAFRNRLPSPIRDLIGLSRLNDTPATFGGLSAFGAETTRYVSLTAFGKSYLSAVSLFAIGMHQLNCVPSYFNKSFKCETREVPERLATLVTQIHPDLQPIELAYPSTEVSALEGMLAAAHWLKKANEVFGDETKSAEWATQREEITRMAASLTCSPVDLVTHSAMIYAPRMMGSFAPRYDPDKRDLVVRRPASALDHLHHIAPHPRRKEEKVKESVKAMRLQVVSLVQGEIMLQSMSARQRFEGWTGGQI